MRGLLKAALVLAPALAYTLVVPDQKVDDAWGNDTPVADHSYAVIGVEVPNKSPSPDHWKGVALEFRLDVLPSEEACGLANITLNGRVLSQTPDGVALKGEGSISTDRKSIVDASWTLNCIKVNNQPEYQFLKFVVGKINGKEVESVGFSALFKQTGQTEIVNINTDLSVPDVIAANPNTDGLLPSSGDYDFPQYGIEDDLEELDWMYAQLHELKLMIAEKKQAIAAHAYEHSGDFEEDIKDCDSLKCVMTAVVQKVKHTAHDVYETIAGDDEIEDGDFGHFPKKPHWKPHWPKIPNPFHPSKGKHGNYTHGNHTCGHPKNGTNHTHPPPHWRKPHRFLPICRLPHHKGPHHKPPPHDGPHDGPPHHGGPPNGPHHPPPPPSDQALFHDSSIEHDEGSSPSPMHVLDIHRPPPPKMGPPGHGRRRISQIVKFTVIGFLCAFLLLALHRRACTPKKRADRKARREERFRRRAYRRASRKHSIRRFLSRMPSDSDTDSTSDWDEKCEKQLSDAEDGLSTTMTEEIAQFQNAASVVDDIVSAQEGRARTIAYAHGYLPEPIPIPPQAESGLIRNYDFGSQVGDGEELPAYEDNDGSDMSSMVADGFRYTPGTSDYSPAHSVEGSMSDILGPDTKT